MTVARIEAWLNRRWYGDRPARFLLPLAWLYGAAVALRRAAYRVGVVRSVRVGVPVVIVGNLTAGGSGKTPVVLALAQALREEGRAPGIVSRGYGARISGVRVIQPGDSADAVGDEPALMAERRIAPVAIGADRLEAARALLAAHEIDVIISDDGLQHLRLARDVEIVVVDGARGFGNGALLPAGPLREPAARLADIDFVLVNGRDWEGYPAFRLVPGAVRKVADPVDTQPLHAFRGRRVHAVAGIGHPHRFFDMLARAGVFVVPHPMPDHHRFRRADITFGDDLPVLVTEKDAVKCVSIAHDGLWCVPVDAELAGGFPAEVRARLERRE